MDIVFVHGSGCNGTLWSEQIAHPSKHHRAVALDLPGHGETPGPPLSTIPELSEFVYAELRRLRLERPVVAGHSLGGGIALQLALDHQDELGGLVLIGTGARLRVMPALFDEVHIDYGKALDTMATVLFCSRTPVGPVEKVMVEHRKVPADVFLSNLTACDRFDVMARVAEIRLPALIIVGREDKATPPKYADYLHNNLPGSRLLVVEDAGHMVMVEQPAIVNAAIEDFLEGLE